LCFSSFYDLIAKILFIVITVDYVCSWEFTGTEEEGAKSIPYQLQRLFLQLQVQVQHGCFLMVFLLNIAEIYLTNVDFLIETVEGINRN